jgi:hypothetical protein
MSGLTPDDQDAVLGNLLDEFDQATAKLDAVERCPWSPVTLQAAAKGSHVLPSCRVFRRVSLGLQADHVASQRIFLEPSTPPAPTYHGFADLVPTAYPNASEISNLKRASMVATCGNPQNNILDLSSRRVPVRRKASRPLSWLRLG